MKNLKVLVFGCLVATFSGASFSLSCPPTFTCKCNNNAQGRDGGVCTNNPPQGFSQARWFSHSLCQGNNGRGNRGKSVTVPLVVSHLIASPPFGPGRGICGYQSHSGGFFGVQILTISNVYTVTPNPWYKYGTGSNCLPPNNCTFNIQ